MENNAPRVFGRNRNPINVDTARILVYGDAKVGKSYLFSGHGELWYIDTNDGLGSIDAPMTTGHISDWDGLRQAYDTLRQAVNDGDGPTAVVIDTVNDAFDLAAADLCRKAGKRSIEDWGYGEGYTRTTQRLMDLLRALEDLGLGVYLIAHAKTKKFAGLHGGDISKEVPELTASTTREIVTWVDCIMYMTLRPVDSQKPKHKGEEKYRGVERVLVTGASPHHAASGRYITEPPEMIRVPRAPQAWDTVRAVLAKAFGSDQEKRPEEPDEPTELV